MEEWLLRKFEKYYHSYIGLLVGCLLLFLFIIIPLDNFILKELLTAKERLFISGDLLFIFWPSVWVVLRNYLPKCKKGSIGIVVAISSENQKQEIRLKNDFVKRIKELCISNDLKNFDILILNNHQTNNLIETINAWLINKETVKKLQSITREQSKSFKKWENLKRITRGHYYIYGDIKERKDVENTYFLRLSSAVIHKPIDFAISDKIQKEMDKTFTRGATIPERFEMRGFQISADMTFFAAEYILGICAFVSSDPQLAFKIHESLNENLKNLPVLNQQQQEMKKNLGSLIAEELAYLARVEYISSKDITKINNLLDKALTYDPNNFVVIGNRSFFAMVLENDPKKSSRWSKKAKKANKDDFTWLYNEAYNDLVEKCDFINGLKKYKRLENLTFQNETNIVYDCITTDEMLYEKHPKKKQILFILGWLYYKKRNNSPVAFEKFEKFVKEAKGDTSYNLLINQAENYLQEIKVEMEIN